MKPTSTYGLTLIAALILFSLSSSTMLPLLALGAAAVPWESVLRTEDGAYVNLAALVPFLFYLNVDSGTVLNNVIVVAVTFLLLHVVKEYMTLFDFGSEVRSKVHVAYNPATSNTVTYANGETATVLQCMHDEQCPADQSCQLSATNNVKGQAACEKAWNNVYTPALCSKSHTRCEAAADCSRGEACRPASCATKFCGKNKKCWGECRKKILR